MREENFIAFCVVFGFFIGLMIGFVTQNDPINMLSVVAVTTLFFYLLAHVSVGLFIRFMEFGKVHFEKEAYDRKLDYFYNQLLQREAGFESNHTFYSNGDNQKMKEGRRR